MQGNVLVCILLVLLLSTGSICQDEPEDDGDEAEPEVSDPEDSEGEPEVPDPQESAVEPLHAENADESIPPTSCYALNKPKGRSVNTDYRLQYFNLFTKGQKGRAAGSADPALYACWDAEHESDIRRLTEKIRPTEMFAGFNPTHKSAVGDLVDLINGHSGSTGELVSFLQYLREHRGKDIHPQLLISANFAVSNSGKTSLYKYTTPALADILPSRFFSKLQTQASKGRSSSHNYNNKSKCQLVNERNGWVNGEENKLWYFREDIQLNSHHWMWHLSHPVVTKDPPIHRRGELFYYFHHDMLARYGAERISNGFSDHFVEPILIRENLTIVTGYKSFLHDGVSSLKWVDRPNNTVLSQANTKPRQRANFPKAMQWWTRLQEVVNTGVAHGYGGDVMLVGDGTNSLGETIEAGNYSLNTFLYGRNGWHGLTHTLLAYIIVPESEVQDESAVTVLGDEATAIRDFIFYRIHTGVDTLFRTFKHQVLKPYELHSGEHPLIYHSVTAKSLLLQAQKLKPNHLKTFWKNRNIEMERGLDFIASKDDSNSLSGLTVCAKHLDHVPFSYIIQLENHETIDLPVFVRIFMAPRYSADDFRFNITDQFRLAFTMDAFPYTLKPGHNKIERKSIDSSLTVDWWIPVKDISKRISSSSETPPNANCLCGWPQHLLLPKGTEDGLEFDVILMVTDGSDFTAPDPKHPCTKAYLHCGYNGGKAYPDKKPMGYPFDRRVHPTMETGYIDKLVNQVQNMALTTVKIFHDDVTPVEHLSQGFLEII